MTDDSNTSKKPTQSQLVDSTHEIVWLVLLTNILMLGYIGLTEYRVQKAQAEITELEQALGW